MTVQLALQVASAATLVVLSVPFASLFFRQMGTHPKMYVAIIEKCERSGDRVRTTKVCRAIPRSPLAHLTVFMVGLELPRRTVTGSARSYRDVSPMTSFEDAVLEAVNGEITRLTRILRIPLLLALGSGLLLAILAAAAWWLRVWEGPVEGMVSAAPAIQAGLGLLGVLFAVRGWRRMRRGFALLRERLIPVLVPVEEMREDQKEGAAAAQRLHSEWREVRPSKRMLVIVACAVALAAAAAIVVVRVGGPPS